MAWTISGGQAILTLRSLIQSDRWASAWQLLQADFRKEVKVIPIQPDLPVISLRFSTSLMNSAHQLPFTSLPLAV
jgi:CMP-2-keto-3-deoxyoctulosonic acid synthetase